MRTKKTSRRDFLKKVAKTSLVASAALGAPAVLARSQFRWKMVTTWPKNFPALGTGANYLAKIVTEMSGGRIQVKVFGANELVPALGVFDAVSRGTAEMGHGAAYYWKGKHEASQFFAAVPFGLNASEMNGWLKFGGAIQLWNELYSAFNLVPFSAGSSGVQMGGWFNKKILSVSAFKGLKMRMPGLGGEVLRRLGSTVVTLPGGEIFQALKSGAIDATEWVGPYNDLAFGFHQAAKYYYWPGWHEPGTILECMVNKTAYQKLPAELQKIVEHACFAAHNSMWAEFTARNSSALDVLIKKHKVRLERFPNEVLQAIGKVSKETVAEIAGKDPFSKRVFQSFQKFRKEAVGYDRVADQGYSQARALTFG